MKHLPIVTILALLLLTALPLRADRTLRGKLRPVAGSTRGATVEKPDSAAAVFDTIPSPAPETVRLSGYDKPLGSRVESLFVSNRLDRDIIALEITLTYRDLQGRTLHEATRRMRADIPASSSRRGTLRTHSITAIRGARARPTSPPTTSPAPSAAASSRLPPLPQPNKTPPEALIRDISTITIHKSKPAKIHK